MHSSKQKIRYINQIIELICQSGDELTNAPVQLISNLDQIQTYTYKYTFDKKCLKMNKRLLFGMCILSIAVCIARHDNETDLDENSRKGKFLGCKLI